MNKEENFVTLSEIISFTRSTYAFSAMTFQNGKEKHSNLDEEKLK